MKSIRYILIVLGTALVVFLVLLYISISSDHRDFATSEIMMQEDIDVIDFREYDSVLLAASTFYKGNFIKEMMQGENYRRAWITPIRVPIVFLDTLKGGVEVMEKGGGKQTHSLELEADNGIRYALRGIAKDPEPLVPQFARTLGLENIIIDGVSAQHPYAAVVAASLSEAAGVLHPHPEIVFVPRQPRLSQYNEKYGNRLFILEYESKNEVNWTSLNNVEALVDTDNLQKLKKNNPKNVSIDQHALVRARLFDILIGDWDRHAKQWGWVIQKIKEKYVATPLAVDRDNAFFKIDGLIPTIVSNEAILPGLQAFKEEIEYLPGLVMPFDVYFLSGTPKSVFLEEAEKLQNRLTDKAIYTSLRIWPSEIYDLDAEDIANKIIVRRNNLLQFAAGFYDILASRDPLSHPLKGSGHINLPEKLEGCFECF